MQGISWVRVSTDVTYCYIVWLGVYAVSYETTMAVTEIYNALYVDYNIKG